MPGKVNPVVPEVVGIVAFRVIGNDYSVSLASHSGQLQLNAYEPLNGLMVIESQHLLFNVSKLFRTKCVDGITINEKVLAHYMETTVGIVTALNPVLGYEKATELAAEAYTSGKGILEIIREKKVLTEQQIADLLDPVKLTNLDPQSTRRSNDSLNGRRWTHENVTHDRSARACAAACGGRHCANCEKPNIVILATGGTIAGAAASQTDAGYQSGAVGVDLLIQAVPNSKISPTSPVSKSPASAART